MAKTREDYTKEQLDRLPVEPTTGQPILPMAQPGYYPGYSTLSQQKFWDEATRTLVLDRVANVPPMRFFTGDDERLFRAVVDRILPQDDRDEAHRIPVANMMDRDIYEGKIDGYRFEDMPPMQEAHRLGLQAIEAIARHLYQKSFVDLDQTGQDQVLLSIHDGNPPAGQAIWQRMSINHYWTLLMQTALEAYYSHPYAWDEVGFGGPAYPRPYFRQERGEPEPWEVDEERYDWAPPDGALSGSYRAMSGIHPHRSHAGSGAGGTH
jgi:hypothetical protein